MLAQNEARMLAELPGNHLTPTLFVEYATKMLASHHQVSITSRDQEWIQSKGMNAFLSVARGSVEEPRFLELEYRGNPNNKDTVVLVGKGVTFDSGGISIKPSANMDMMKGKRQ
jgi:aminopeptidase